MLRRLAIAALLVAAAPAVRADPAPCAPAPVDTTLRRLQVQSDGSAGGVLVAAPGSQFPAVSDDGTTIVDLFHDETDFVGVRVTTVQTFTRRGPGASVQMSGGIEGTDTPATPDEVQAQTRAVIDANALLAKHRWRALPLAVACPAPGPNDPIDQALRVDFGDGLHIALDPDTAALTSDGRAIAQRFPAPGSGEFGGCGGVTGIVRAYGSRKIGFVVLEPSAQLGGDSCIGKLGVENTIVVPIP